MDEIERYLFDTQGYLVIDDVLSSDQVLRLLSGIPRLPDGTVASRSRHPEDKLILGYPEPLFRELINHPRILPYLEALVAQRGDPRLARSPGFYLQHEYEFAMRRGEAGPWFHNGGTPHEPWWGYQVRDGKIFCGLTAVVWILTDAAEGDGGFWCIPGSHKANFPLPRAIETYQVVPSSAKQPAVRAGSVIIFTEALTHGTRDWKAAHERVALFYKYAPAWMADSSVDLRPASTMALMSEDQVEYLSVPRAMKRP